jgi:hypothetical protein
MPGLGSIPGLRRKLNRKQKLSESAEIFKRKEKKVVGPTQYREKTNFGPVDDEEEAVPFRAARTSRPQTPEGLQCHL